MENIYTMAKKMEENKRYLDEVNHKGWKLEKIHKEKPKLPMNIWKNKETKPVCCAPCC